MKLEYASDNPSPHRLFIAALAVAASALFLVSVACHHSDRFAEVYRDSLVLKYEGLPGFLPLILICVGFFVRANRRLLIIASLMTAWAFCWSSLPIIYR